MSRQLTVGSLFDGAGGFPLAATRVGVRPVWASEIEPLPILVTTTRLPGMRHLGDIHTIDGRGIEPVDVVTFGSPCQDLSVAGPRVGLAGARSGLFFEAVRIIKHMREATHDRYPRFAVWENVPGALWSRQGADFHQVLTNLIAIVDQQAAADLPRVPRWETAGLIVGDRWSIAWRVLDAQYFGVPQRRRRIFLIADFANPRAHEILFESTCRQRDPESSSPKTQTHPTGLIPSTTSDCRCDANTVDVRRYSTDPFCDCPPAGATSANGEVDTCVQVFGVNSVGKTRPAGGTFGYETGVAKTLDINGGTPTCNQGGMIILQPAPVPKSGNGAEPVVGCQLRPRRLTPRECGRLQGFPDTWTDDLAISMPSEVQIDYWHQVWQTWDTSRDVKPKTRRQVTNWLTNPASDTGLYKLWGNSVAVPVVEFVLKQLVTYAKSTG